MKPLLERGTEALVRELLKQALGELDGIAAEPAPHETSAYLVERYRTMAERTAKEIRDTLRVQSI